MSSFVKSSKRASSLNSTRIPTRIPLSSAAVGVASMMLGGAAFAQAAMDLPTVDVTTQTDVTDYKPTNVTLDRLPTPIRDTPQTINVVTQQVIQDQRATTVLDTLRNVPGLTFNAGEGGTQGDNINIRGYTARNDFYRDGIRDPGWYTRDAFAIQQVEVLKGPSGFLFGRGSTGGIVNVTSKLPQARDFVDIEASGTSVGGHREVVDVNKKFNDGVSGRIVLLGTQNPTAGRDFAETNRFGVAPSLLFNITDRTKLTLSYLYQKDDNLPDYGIPMLQGSYFGTRYQQPAPVSRDTYYQRAGGPFRDFEKVDVNTGTIKLEHEFTDSIKLTNAMRYTNVDRFTRVRAVQVNYTGGNNPPNVFNMPIGGTAYGPNNPIPPGTPLTSLFINNTNDFQNHTINDLTTNQTDLVAKFNTGFVRHTTVTGAEFSYETRDNFRTTFLPNERINFGSPDNFSAPPRYPATATRTAGTTTTKGVYFSDQMKIGDYVELLAGLRYDKFSGTQTIDNINPVTENFVSFGSPRYLSSNNNFLSYRYGVVVHPIPTMSVYYMHGTSANPPAEFVTLTNGQQSLNPVQNETDEVGVKVDVLEGRATVSAAVFKTTQKNAYENLGTTAAPDFRSVGTTQVQGVEVGLVGRLTRDWNILFGYTYLDSRVVETTVVGSLNNELANTPNHSGSVFSTYNITRKWAVGGGAFYQGDRWTSSVNQALAPAFVRYDAFTSYQVNDNFLLQLNAYNLADTTNYESLAGAGWAVPGVGRYFALTGRYKF